MSAASTSPRVFLAGAAGRTGKVVLQKLRERGVQVVGLVRSEAQAAELGAGVVVGDILHPETYQPALAGCNRLVILSSAVPRAKPRPNPSDPPEFYFDEGQEPEQVDWVAQRQLIDAAKALDFQQVVLVSSMGVTRPDHPLNRLGKILYWKKMAEDYLIASNMPYTVVHPGGLLDQPGGRRALVAGKQDSLLDSATRTVPRADVAEVVVQALLEEAALNLDFDLASGPEGEGSPPSKWDVFFETVATLK